MTDTLTRQTLRGVWHALVIPWTDEDDCDEARFRKDIRCFRGTPAHVQRIVKWCAEHAPDLCPDAPLQPH